MQNLLKAADLSKNGFVKVLYTVMFEIDKTWLYRFYNFAQNISMCISICSTVLQIKELKCKNLSIGSSEK